jgi:hypothetical protein
MAPTVPAYSHRRLAPVTSNESTVFRSTTSPWMAASRKPADCHSLMDAALPPTLACGASKDLGEGTLHREGAAPQLSPDGAPRNPRRPS